jgi:hypothetical protein
LEGGAEGESVYVGEVDTIDRLHENGQTPIDSGEAVDADDRRVSEEGQEAGFVAQSAGIFGAGGPSRVQPLDGQGLHKVVVLANLGEMNCAKGALS